MRSLISNSLSSTESHYHIAGWCDSVVEAVTSVVSVKTAGSVDFVDTTTAFWRQIQQIRAIPRTASITRALPDPTRKNGRGLDSSDQDSGSQVDRWANQATSCLHILCNGTIWGVESTVCVSFVASEQHSTIQRFDIEMRLHSKYHVSLFCMCPSAWNIISNVLQWFTHVHSDAIIVYW